MAARLPDVAVPHPHPAVLLRLEQHLLDQAAVLLLHERPVRQLAAVHLEPLRQLVAHTLELAEAEYPRAAARGHLPVETRARVGAAEEARQLGLELRDLAQQGTARRALVDSRFDDPRRPRCQYVGDGSPPSRVHGPSYHWATEPRRGYPPLSRALPPRSRPAHPSPAGPPGARCACPDARHAAPPCRRTGRREDATRRPPRSRRRGDPDRPRPAALPRWPAAAQGRPPHARRRRRAAARRSPPWRSRARRRAGCGS